MDLVGLEGRNTLQEIRDEIEDFLQKIHFSFHDVKFIPMSALSGDNVVDASTNTMV